MYFGHDLNNQMINGNVEDHLRSSQKISMFTEGKAAAARFYMETFYLKQF